MFSHSNIGVVLNFFLQLGEESFVVFVVIKIASESPGGVGLYKTSNKRCSLGITGKPDVIIGSAATRIKITCPCLICRDRNEMVLFWNCARSVTQIDALGTCANGMFTYYLAKSKK